jgi:hypothetical protein
MGASMDEICGVLHGTTLQPHDDDGCLLPMFHEGPHEFRDREGELWRWETDLFCGCDWCMRAEGDYCTTYWRKADDEKLAAAEAEYASWLVTLQDALGVRANSETSSKPVTGDTQ